MKYFQLLKKDRGFTLLEVLLAIAILSIMFTAVMGFFSQSFTYTKQNESKTVGINFARNVLNYIEHQDFEKMKGLSVNEVEVELDADSCSSKSDGKEFLINCNAILNSKINNVEYDAKVLINPEGKTELTNFLIPVTVEVQWNDKTVEVEGVVKK